MPGPRLEVDIQGLQELLRKLEPKELYWQPLKVALTQLGRAGAEEAAESSGQFRRTGILASGNTFKVNNVPAPLWVAVVNNATSRTGRRYAWILEYDARFHHRNWLLMAIRRAQARAGAAVQEAIAAIESKWGS